jgi:hypothetical protein
MEKEKIVDLIKQNLSQREIADKLSVSQSNLRYWLNKFKLKTNLNLFNKGNYKVVSEKKCSKCNELKKVSEFYKRTSLGRKHEVGGYCKKCSNVYHGKRIKEVKIKMIEYKGGKCEHCPLTLKKSHYAVFDFHHVNPKEKDVNFTKIKFQSWEKIKNEIDKCKLLCSNCHRLEHAKIEGW